MMIQFGGKTPQDCGAAFVAPNATVLGDGSLIGMHATLLNHCVIGRNCIIGAGALVPEGMVIPDGSVAVGVPAKIIKTIRPDQAAHNIENAVHYVGDAEAHAEAVKQCEIIETEAKTK